MWICNIMVRMNITKHTTNRILYIYKHLFRHIKCVSGNVIVKYWILYWGILFSAPHPMFGQIVNIIELPNHRQLPVAKIHAVMQDAEGYIWYGTAGGGICRDNGYQIDVFRDDCCTPGLIGEDNEVRYMAEDSVRSRIYFSTLRQLFVLDKHDYSVQEIGQTDFNGRVQAIVVDDDGTVWFAKSKWIVHLDSDYHELSRYEVGNRTTTTAVISMTLDDEERLWAVGWEGSLFRYDRKAKNFVRYEWPKGVQLWDFVEDSTSACFWACSPNRGVLKYIPHKNRTTATIISQPVSQFTSVCRQAYRGIFDRQGRLWVLCEHGIFVYSIVDGTLQVADIQLPEDAMAMNNLVCDRSGNIWIVGASSVRVIASDEKKLPHTSISNADVPSPTFTYTLSRVASLEQHPEYIDTTFIDYRFDHVAVVRDDYNGHLLIGDCNNMYLYDIGKHHLRVVAEEPVRDIAANAEGTVYYIPLQDKLVCINPVGHSTTLDSLHSLTLLTTAPDGELWAANRRGEVFQLKEKRLVVDEAASNSRGDAIIDFCFDDSGHLWVMTDKELKEYEPSTGCTRVLVAGSRTIGIPRFERMYRTTGGIVIGGADMQHFIPNSFSFKADVSVICRVTGLVIDGKPLYISSHTREVELAASTTSVELRFSTLDHINAQDIRFAYRVEGLDGQWHELPQGLNTATLLNLPRGHYRVDLRATDADGRWSEIVEAITLHRLSAWWETWWAFMLYGLAAIGILAFLMNYYVVWQKLKRQRELFIELQKQQVPSMQAPRLSLFFLKLQNPPLFQRIHKNPYLLQIRKNNAY